MGHDRQSEGGAIEGRAIAGDNWRRQLEETIEVETIEVETIRAETRLWCM